MKKKSVVPLLTCEVYSVMFNYTLVPENTLLLLRSSRKSRADLNSIINELLFILLKLCTFSNG